MKLLRRHQQLFSACSAGGYLLLWLTLVLSPCLMAMPSLPAVDHHAGMPAATTSSAPAEHRCEHCPPVQCDLIQADVLASDCDSVNAVLQATSPLDDVDPAPADNFSFVLAQAPQFKHPYLYYQPPLRAGPRRHLLFQQFNE